MVTPPSTKEIQEKASVSFREKSKTFFSNYEMKSLSLFGILMFIFSFFMFIPILSITISAFNFAEMDVSNPSNFFKHFLYCFENPTYLEGIINTLFAGLTTTIICCLIGLTVTIIFSRYKFFGKRFFQILTILPLVSPPFVGAYALSRLLDRNGIVTNLLQLFIPGLPDLLGDSIWGIIFMQSIHLWPLIFFNTSASYSKIDPAQEEQARNLGSWSLSLYRQIILPLITPGFIAGAVLVFIWSISDLGTPIVLNFYKFAPYLAFKDIADQEAAYVEAAYALVIILLFISVIALLFASKIVGMKDYAPEKVSGMDQARLMQQASKPKTALILTVLIFLLIMSLLPHIGIIFVAFVQRIKFGEIIPTLWTLDGVTTALQKANIMAYIMNSLVYSALAMILTILFGIIVGYLLVRKKALKGINIVMSIIGLYIGLIIGAQLSQNFSTSLEVNLVIIGSTIICGCVFFAVGQILNLRTLEIFSTLPFAVPGIVLAVGYLSFFSQIDSLWGLLPRELENLYIFGPAIGMIRQSFLSIPDNPLEVRFTSYWFIFVISYAVRRMPYAVQSSTAVLRQIHESLEEVAHNLGASTISTLRRITIPLMASGVLAGGILSFITSFTEVSTSIMITPTKPAFSPLLPFSPTSDPLTKGIYDEISRGGDVMPAGFMGLIQLFVAAIGMTISQRLLGEKTGTAFGG
jgi:iron(III) transport system permease protein